MKSQNDIIASGDPESNLEDTDSCSKSTSEADVNASNCDEFCKNCNHPVQLKYCPNCGQATKTRRVTFGYLLHDLQHGLFNLESGFLYTLKTLFSNPGEAIRGFLEGKRIRHFRPVTMLLLLSAFYGFLFVNLDSSTAYEISIDDNLNPTIKSAIEWTRGNFPLLILSSVPFFAVCTKILFRKSNYNFVEHLILNVFIAIQKSVVSIVLYPAKLWLVDGDYSTEFQIATTLLDLLIMTWTYHQFFQRKSIIGSLVKSILTYLLSLLLVTAVVATVIVVAFGTLEMGVK